MSTKTCANGHTMTGIGFSECPECEAPWKTPNTTTEEVKREILEEFDKDTACFDIASSCRPEISRLIESALDRMAEVAVAQERDRIWHEHLGLGKPIREVLSPNYQVV